MPTRLLLEGADLAELMVHVRAEFGPRARVVRAERVRSGGVAGFFARERYELTVDVPDEPATAVPTLVRRRPGPVGLESLLDAADAGDERPDGTGPPGFDLVAPSTGTGPGEVLAPGPRVSTGEEAFASVLERMRRLTDGVGVDHQLEVLPTPAGPAPVVPVPAADRVFEPLAPPTAEATIGTVPVAPGASVEPVAPTPPAEPGPGLPVAVLADLGVPAALLAACGDGPVELARLLAAVPPAPPAPRDPGRVHVVVGPPEDAVRVADLLALRAGADGSTVVVHAGDVDAATGHGRRLTTPAAAERWRARLAGTDPLTVVALGVRPGRSHELATAELLAALAPDQVWAAVDARSKVRDCLRWLAAIGARRTVDALAVSGLFDTSEPGTVLGLGVPVAWIDGVPASRVAWAAALGEHLPAGTVWG
ncbi:MAG TPA: hypothetical protein VGC67_06310 [Cellulomonas sp.]